jgi:hypothetical protein
LVDEFLPKIEEWVEKSKGKIRADVAPDKLLAKHPATAGPNAAAATGTPRQSTDER